MSKLQQRKPIPQMLHALGKRFSKVSIGSRSDWLAGLIEVARAATAAAELAPFPYIKSAAGSLLVLLQAIEVCSLLLTNKSIVDRC
jgi:hypothetical protein